MNSNKKTARIVGALFLIVIVTNIIGSEYLESILYDPDYLTNAYPNKIQMIIGVLLELICAVAAVGIAVMLFPILKKHNETIARGYLGFRIIESAIYIVSLISTLSLLTLSQEYVKAGAPDASYFQTLGTLLLAERYWAYLMLIIVFSFGALLFYSLLYQSKLIPRFISVWGIIGATLVLVGALLDMFGYDLEMMIYGAAMGLNELFLGIWLIAKGFNSSSIAFESAKTDINEV